MRYRTLIELVCEASDREEASNIAGDYLKGEVEFGVDMNCRTTSLWEHRVKRYAASCVLVIMVFASLLLRVTPVEVEHGKTRSLALGMQNTYTIMPELKTKNKRDFKQKWQRKKEEAVIEYLKK